MSIFLYCLLVFKPILFFSSSNPTELTWTLQWTNFTYKICELFIWHYFKCLVPLFSIKIIYTFTFCFQTHLTYRNLLLNFLTFIFLHFRTTLLCCFIFGSIGHIGRFNVGMLILHMCVQSSIGAITFST